MDNPIPELSPDIEWMLESGQASSVMLAEALVREYIQPIVRFALAYLNDPQLAEKAAVESLSLALVQSYSYRGGSVPAWLFQIVLQVCRKKKARYSSADATTEKSRIWNLDSVPAAADPGGKEDDQLWKAVGKISRKNRLPFLFSYLYQWPVELVAETLKASPKTIAAQLKIVRRKLIETLSATGYPPDELEFGRLDAHIHQLMEQRWPGMLLDSVKLEDTITAVISEAEQQRSRHLSLASVKEILLVVIVIAMAAGLIYGGNLLYPEPEPTRPPVRTGVVTRIVEVVTTPTPFTAPTATVTQTPLPLPATPQPLTVYSSSDDIRDRIFFGQFYYRTLWVDALLTFYGPEGFDGAPQAYRTQIWIDNTFPASLIVSGAPDTQAEEISLHRSGIGYWTEIDGLPPYKLHEITESQSLRSFYAARLALYQPTVMDYSGTYRVTGGEEMLGRESLIVDYTNLAGQRAATLWLDSVTGLPLRKRYYGTSQDDLRFEVRLLDLAIDPEISSDLFNPEYPWTGAFAENVNNQSLSVGRVAPDFYVNAYNAIIPLPFASAPADFNPQESKLFFQIAQMYYANPPSEPLPALYKASLFTKAYYLGQLDFEDPWGMICDRSDDGIRLAVSSNETPDRSPLRWFNLMDISATNGKTYFDKVTQFAFAPDSRRLAVFASREPYGSVYIMDTESDELTHLIDLPDARSFVWSPDGDYLAMIGRVSKPVAGDEVIVIRASNGEIIYRQSVDYGTGNIGDWPPLEWGVDFPVEMNGLAQCALPPGG